MENSMEDDVSACFLKLWANENLSNLYQGDSAQCIRSPSLLYTHLKFRNLV